MGKGELFRQASLPVAPLLLSLQISFFGRVFVCKRKPVEHLGQLFLEPRVQNAIGATGDALHADLSAGRMKQRQKFSGPGANVFMRLAGCLLVWLPTETGLWDALKRTGFVFITDDQALPLAQQISLFDQLFFASASASVTMTGPSLR